MNNAKIILDSDFVIALYLPSDSNHVKAFNIYQQYDDYSILSINLYEIATVLSRLLNQDEAIIVFCNIIKDFDEIVVDFEREWEGDIINIYNSFSKKNISFVDCSILYIAKKLNAKIATFDKFYPSELLA
jgi:predicted nucleic acid-binding protein